MAATNTLLNSTVIINELLDRFQNNLKAGKLAKHVYEDELVKGGRYVKKGGTISVLDPVKYTTADAAAISLNNTVEKNKSLTIGTQTHVAFEFSSKDLTLTIDKFGEKYLNSASAALANRVDIGLLTMMVEKCPNQVGTAGTVPSELRPYLDAKAALWRNGCPDDGDLYVVTNESMEVEIVDSLQVLNNPNRQISSQYLDGKMTRAAGMNWLMDQNVRTHTSGSATRATLAVSAGGNNYVGSSLPAEGAGNGGTLEAGDIFTIAGVYAVNPVSGDTLAELRQFTVTEKCTADGGGVITIKCYPEIIFDAPYKTVSKKPATGDAITVVGTASQAYPVGIVAHPLAFQWATVPMEMPQGVHMAARQTDPDTGVSMRMVSQYNIATDIFATRVDILWGVGAFRPEWACKIAS